MLPVTRSSKKKIIASRCDICSMKTGTKRGRSEELLVGVLSLGVVGVVSIFSLLFRVLVSHTNDASVAAYRGFACVDKIDMRGVYLSFVLRNLV